MRAILDVVAIGATLYLAGLVLVLATVATGYEGGDLMTEHYRSVLQAIIN